MLSPQQLLMGCPTCQTAFQLQRECSLKTVTCQGTEYFLEFQTCLVLPSYGQCKQTTTEMIQLLVVACLIDSI